MGTSPNSSLFTFLSDIETSENRSTLTSRLDNSLSVITKKFLNLLRHSSQTEIDLNYAASTLEIHKRRLYDITNVLEGIGYIKKKMKNNVQYTGGTSNERCESCGGTSLVQTKETEDTATLLRIEKQIDDQITQVNNELQHLANQEESIDLAYITYTDLKNIEEFSALSLFAVKTPPGTILDFPASDNTTESILTLSCTTGKIDVFYLQDLIDTM
ncbi:transcription factor E2F3 [Nematocida sp. AWRm80]|nr:transcription factor E2F3 [Nematocida sp. AWRm80]